MNLLTEYNTVFGSPDMYRRLVENLHAGIYVADSSGKLVYVNQAFITLLGYSSKDELIGVNWADRLYVHPQDRQEFLEKIKKTGFVRNYEIENKKKDGSLVVLSITSDLIFDEYNRIVGVEGVVYDITDQKRILSRRSMLEKAVSQSLDHIVITDKDGAIQYVNPAFERTTGYSWTDVAGLTPRILQSGHQSAEFYRSLWDTIMSGHVFNARITNRKKNGEEYVADVTISPIVDDAKHVTHFVSNYKDVADWIGSTETRDF